MKIARKIIFIIMVLLPITPLICQVVGNIGNTELKEYSWGSSPRVYFDIYDYDLDDDGEIEELISMDISETSNTINDIFIKGLYDGADIKTSTFMGGILKTTYVLMNTLGIPFNPAWVYAILFVIYLIFIEIIMLITDITLLIPRKIKEWIN